MLSSVNICVPSDKQKNINSSTCKSERKTNLGESIADCLMVEEYEMAELRKEDLWVMADKLRNNMDSAEYKHVCLGLIFLKYISDSFERAYQEISQDEYADPEDRDEYLAKNVFWVPQEARWETIKNSQKIRRLVRLSIMPCM